MSAKKHKSKKKKRKRKKKGPSAAKRRRRMSRQVRLADARQWLPTQQGGSVLRAYERWYFVDRLCAIKELRLLGVPISEEYEARILESRARRSARRAAKRSAKERAAAGLAPSTDPREGLALSEWGWNEYHDPPADWDDAGFAAEYGEVAGGFSDGSGAREELPIKATLLERIRGLALKEVETQIETLGAGIVRVRIALEADPAVLTRCAWDLIFALGALSFTDASADLDFDPRDGWGVDDMLRCLAFEHGRLCFRADHLYGCCMKTTIEIDSEGKIVLETVDRGEVATRWIAKLRDPHARGRDSAVGRSEPKPRMPMIQGGQDDASPEEGARDRQGGRRGVIEGGEDDTSLEEIPF
jgi:hypothetical protein